MIRTLPSRIAVLRGGVSAEAEYSLREGREVLQVLEAAAPHQLFDVVVTKSGEWLVAGIVRAPEQILSQVDLVVITLHGEYGEDGTVQRIVEQHGVPYLGSRPYASAISLNKLLTKEHIRGVTVRQPRHLRVTAEGVSDIYALVSTIQSLFGPQYILKPIRGGAGIGNRVVREGVSLASELSAMLKHYPDVLIEEYLEGIDATCGVLENFRGQQVYLTPVVEVAVAMPQETIFSAEKIAPGRFTKDIKNTIATVTAAVHKNLALRHLSRADFRVTPKGEVYFLEVNTLPALSSNSPLMAGLTAVGASQEELICSMCGNVINGL